MQHTDQTLMAGGRGLAAALDMSPDDIGSIAFPYSHIAGPGLHVDDARGGLRRGAARGLRPADAVAVFRELGVTMCGGSTAFYQMYLAEQRKSPGEPIVPSLRIMSGGGAAKPPEIFYDVQREMGVRVVHGYGMTEVPMMAMGSPHDTDEQLAETDGTAGRRRGDPDRARGRRRRRARTRRARYGCADPVVCVGYTDPAANAAAFDAEGWFRTGDLGVLRPDGHLRLTGRLKDVIIRKGENISARELEEVLFSHPKVAEVAVIGLPDRERGELVCAVVELVGAGRRADLRRDDRVVSRRRADDAEDPGAARDRRTAPAQRVAQQGAEVQAARAVRRRTVRQQAMSDGLLSNRRGAVLHLTLDRPGRAERTGLGDPGGIGRRAGRCECRPLGSCRRADRGG